MTARDVRRSIATIWLWGGRLLLILGPLAYATLILTDLDGQQSTGTEQTVPWLDGAIIAVALAFCIALPLLIAPVSSAVLIAADGDSLSARTVLGRRRLEVTTLTGRGFDLPGNGWDWEVEILRDGAGRTVFVVGSQLWDFAGDASLPEIASGSDLPWFVGWIVMLGWIALSVTAFLLPLMALL